MLSTGIPVLSQKPGACSVQRMEERAVTTLAERLSAARRRLKFTQTYVAKACGMSQAMYSDLELGRSLGTTRLATIAHVLNVDAYWLETGVGSADLPDGAVREDRAAYSVMNNEKAALLAAFDALPPSKRRALLDLIRPDGTAA